jgi:hypothetical protein
MTAITRAEQVPVVVHLGASSAQEPQEATDGMTSSPQNGLEQTAEKIEDLMTEAREVLKELNQRNKQSRDVASDAIGQLSQQGKQEQAEEDAFSSRISAAADSINKASFRVSAMEHQFYHHKHPRINPADPRRTGTTIM